MDVSSGRTASKDNVKITMSDEFSETEMEEMKQRLHQYSTGDFQPGEMKEVKSTD